MRIHTNIADSPIGISYPQAFTDAANAAGVYIESFSVHGSRSRARAFDVTLSGSGRTGGQYGNSGNYGAAAYKAATWDEWGMFLAHLFAIDPDARIADVYESAEHFHWVTGGRYRTLTPEGQHVRHNWLSGDSLGWSAGHAYHVRSCKCGAILRRGNWALVSQSV